MKILQVIPRFDPILGGGVNVVFNVSKALAKRGHQVTIITTKCGFNEEFAKEINEYGVTVVSFGYLFDMHLFIPSPSMEKWLVDNLRDFDLVHLNGARSYQNNLVVKYAIKYDIPYVLQPHGSMRRIVEIKSLKLMYDLVWGYKIYKKASMVIALNRSELDACKQMGIKEEHLVIIPNGIDLESFASLPEKGEFRHKYDIHEGTQVLLYLGRLHKSKGLELLLESYARVAKQVDDSVLLMIGPDGGLSDELKSLSKKLSLSDNVIFTGALDEIDKKRVLVDSNVFITPRFYGFPITFCEACVCGLPIITSSAGEHLDWIDNKAGYLADYDPESFASKIVDLLKDEKTLKQFCEESKRLAKYQFNWSIIGEKLESVYEDILSSGMD